jgi:hypothetical protein
MSPTTAYAVLEADRTGNRSGFFQATLATSPGPARRGWFVIHPSSAREYLGPSWSKVVAAAKAEIADRDAENRDREIASAVASGSPVADVAAVHGLTPARAGQIARAAGVETRPGRRPTGAVTHHTARGRALLARLVAAAAARGIEPEAAIDEMEKR